jgi:5-methylthioadenosine/S-adenosylhomocysteine deaminase
MKYDLLITGGMLLTMSPQMNIIEDPAIGIKDGKIISILSPSGGGKHNKLSPSGGGRGRFDEKHGFSDPASLAKEVIDASNCIIIPGLVNTHTHLAMTCFRGLADDLPLLDWWHNYIFPAEMKHVNRDMVYHGSVLGMAEMLLSGTTTFCDGYFHEGAVSEAAICAGMRAVPAQGFLDLPAPSPAKTEKNVRVAENFIKKWLGVSPLVTPALTCHTAFTCGPDTIKAIKKIAHDAGVPFWMHVAEARDEVEVVKERYGSTPVRHLNNLGVLDSTTTAVHAVWLDDEEISIMARTGATVSHNPESNMKLASGIAPVPKMIASGIRVGLGTDGSASNNDLDMFGEMNMAAKLHKVAALDPVVLDSKTVLRMATIDGAAVLGLASVTGSIETGKSADIILIDVNQPHLTPLYNPYSHIVYACSGPDVKTVIVHGKTVVKDRRLLTINIDSAIGEVNRIAKEIARQ